MKKLHLQYLLGLFETDKSFQILFKKDKSTRLNYRVFPVCIFTQKNAHILNSVFYTLSLHNIFCKHVK